MSAATATPLASAVSNPYHVTSVGGYPATGTVASKIRNLIPSPFIFNVHGFMLLASVFAKRPAAENNVDVTGGHLGFGTGLIRADGTRGYDHPAPLPPLPSKERP